MATFNSCQFIGRLGKEPDFTIISSGTPVAKFSLAVDQGKNKNTGKDNDPLWLNVVAWDKLAEIVEKYAFKGVQVFVQGRLVIRPYEDKTGAKRQAVELVASTVQLLEKHTNGSSTTTATSRDLDDDPFLNDIPE